MSMDREHILSIMYEMAQVIGGEVSVQPLLAKTLQHLLYNTSFPCGFVCLGAPFDAADSEGMVRVSLDAVVGDYELVGLAGSKVRLPARLLLGKTERREDADLLAALPCKETAYTGYLRLPVDGQGVIVLLAPKLPQTDLPLEQLFLPVMANLARAIMLCRNYDAYTGSLIAAREASQRALATSEEKFEAISTAVPDALIMLDDLGAVEYWNPAAERILGYRGEEIRGKILHDLLAPQKYREPARRGFGAFRESGQGDVVGKAIELEAQHKDGHIIPVELSISALKLDGRWHAVGILRDITGRKQTEAELFRLNAELERRVAERTAQLETAVYDLENFNYSASHDLRIPLRAVEGFSKILLDDYAPLLDKEGVRLLNVVRDNTKKIAQYIDDMLAFSYTGRMQMLPAKIGMTELVREVYDELKPTVAGRQLDFVLNPLPPVVADRAMMRRVVINLLANALKFTRLKAAAKIEVGAKSGEAETEFFVRDNGAGFDMRYVHKLFGVFQRLHGVEEFEGTGIGLAIVKRIIARHGGRVWAEGNVNEGATVYFSLPTSAPKERTLEHSNIR
jgi:PAS domain S-box-containing protein